MSNPVANANEAEEKKRIAELLHNEWSNLELMTKLRNGQLTPDEVEDYLRETQ
jgi:hypothetical protein